MWWNKKTKELVDKELELYKRERTLEIDEVIHAIKAGRLLQTEEAEIQFFSEKEKRNTELAKLGAMLEDKKLRMSNLDADGNAIIESKDKIISALEKQITQLNDLVQFMATKLSTVDLKSIGVTAVVKEK